MAKKGNQFYQPLLFHTLNERDLTFDDVCQRIIQFMKQEPLGKYRLMLGTDSHIHGSTTLFVTGIMIHREGKGAWGCIRKVRHPRRYDVLHEKISMETTLTEEVAYQFSEEYKNKMIDIVLPHIYKGASFTIEGHIDIGAGKQNKTRVLIREMVSRIESVGLEPKIKPDSIAASAYANRHTK